MVICWFTLIQKEYCNWLRWQNSCSIKRNSCWIQVSSHDRRKIIQFFSSNPAFPPISLYDFAFEVCTVWTDYQNAKVWAQRWVNSIILSTLVPHRPPHLISPLLSFILIAPFRNLRERKGRVNRSQRGKRLDSQTRQSHRFCQVLSSWEPNHFSKVSFSRPSFLTRIFCKAHIPQPCPCNQLLSVPSWGEGSTRPTLTDHPQPIKQSAKRIQRPWFHLQCRRVRSDVLNKKEREGTRWQENESNRDERGKRDRRCGWVKTTKGPPTKCWKRIAKRERRERESE